MLRGARTNAKASVLRPPLVACLARLHTSRCPSGYSPPPPTATTEGYERGLPPHPKILSCICFCRPKAGKSRLGALRMKIRSRSRSTCTHNTQQLELSRATPGWGLNVWRKRHVLSLLQALPPAAHRLPPTARPALALKSRKELYTPLALGCSSQSSPYTRSSAFSKSGMVIVPSFDLPHTPGRYCRVSKAVDYDRPLQPLLT